MVLLRTFLDYEPCSSFSRIESLLTTLSFSKAIFLGMTKLGSEGLAKPIPIAPWMRYALAPLILGIYGVVLCVSSTLKAGLTIYELRKDYDCTLKFAWENYAAPFGLAVYAP